MKRLAILVLALPIAANADLLVIDISDPSAVEITATGNASPASFIESTLYGFSLDNFFDTTSTGFRSLSVSDSTLSSVAGDPQTSNRARINENDLNISSFSDLSVLYEMTTGARAFTGSITVDMSEYSAWLRPVGTSGEILGDFDPFLEPVLGSWPFQSVCPNPPHSHSSASAWQA